ncbi:MAG: hypothetical protein ACRDP6_32095 [Actinoallomurus sp.]
MKSRVRTVVVLTALNEEYQAVRTHLKGLRKREHHTGTLFEVGELPGTRWQIALAVIGEGNQTSAVITERAINMFHPELILFVGIAGALKDEIKIGDVVVATRVYAIHGGKEQDGEFLTRPRSWDAPHKYEQLARHVENLGDWGQQTIYFKPIAAGEVVLNSRYTLTALQLRQRYNDAVAIENESAGLAQAGHLNQGHPVLAIRGISDRADGTKLPATDVLTQRLAAKNAATFAFAFIHELATRQNRAIFGDRRWRFIVAIAAVLVTLATLIAIKASPSKALNLRVSAAVMYLDNEEYSMILPGNREVEPAVLKQMNSALQAADFHKLLDPLRDSGGSDVSDLTLQALVENPHNQDARILNIHPKLARQRAAPTQGTLLNVTSEAGDDTMRMMADLDEQPPIMRKVKADPANDGFAPGSAFFAKETIRVPKKTSEAIIIRVVISHHSAVFDLAIDYEIDDKRETAILDNHGRHYSITGYRCGSRRYYASYERAYTKSGAPYTLAPSSTPDAIAVLPKCG